MKIVKAIIEGHYLIPPDNEPWKASSLVIDRITHQYETQGYEEFLNTMFGIEPEDEFYEILDENCEVELRIKNVADKDNYYKGDEFKNVCFNRSPSNPYQLPKWTQIE